MVGLLLMLPATAGSHPGHGPPLVHIEEFKFTPATVNVVEGDYVFWDWPGVDRNHSVTADPGQSMTFDSDEGKSAGQVNHAADDGFSVQFKKAGTYTYVCKVHSSMKGKVVVSELPDTPPATKPKLSKVSVAVKGHRLVVRFTVNEAVTMRATIRRASGKRVKEIDFSGPPGANRRTLKLGALADGRYKLSLVAVDASTGFSTKPVIRAFTLG